MMNEKNAQFQSPHFTGSRLADVENQPDQPRAWNYKLFSTLSLAVFFTVFVFPGLELPYVPSLRSQSSIPTSVATSQCPDQLAIGPRSNPDITDRNLVKLFPSDEFKNLSVERLQGAVQIPTVSYDDNGAIGEDPRWDVFYDLQEYFRETFPLLHEKLELEVVNVHNLVYTWRGSDSSLRPVLITGHQDVVPISEDTLKDWTYPPFSGYFDGTYINGRGAHDCKNNVVAILSSITALLEAGFAPRRTIVLGFGINEESPTQTLGAYQIAQHLEWVWARPSSQIPFVMLLDEGVIGITKMYNRTFGIPQASEKGAMDVKLRVHVPGGHSSTPPAHTSIGILSQAVTALEDSHRSNFRSTFTAHNPFYTQMHCAAEDPFTDLTPTVRAAVLRESGDPDSDNREVASLLRDDSAADIYLHTTQAVTIFHSGDKSNSIPANAEMLVNYRISIDENITWVQDAIVQTLRPIASKFALNFVVREEDDEATVDLPTNTLSISWWRHIEPAPVSTHNSVVWKHLSGVIKHVFDEPGEGNDVLVTPSLAVGMTDTKYYWDLSDQIYRFGPLRAWHDKGWGNLHSVNERISLAAHLESLTFYHELIRVFDEAELED